MHSIYLIHCSKMHSHRTDNVVSYFHVSSRTASDAPLATTPSIQFFDGDDADQRASLGGSYGKLRLLDAQAA